MGLARAMGAVSPNGGPGAPRPGPRGGKPADVAADVAALDRALDASDRTGLDDGACATRAANIRDAAAAGEKEGRSENARACLARCVDWRYFQKEDGAWWARETNT